MPGATAVEFDVNVTIGFVVPLLTIERVPQEGTPMGVMVMVLVTSVSEGVMVNE